ncbi:MAG: hypothetical protein CL791_01770 [Chloroflexi bacterium]|nr:hypothetical protein [Chloroflexota bacterium]
MERYLNVNERSDLGLVDYLQCESVGEPGARTFNVTARSARGEAVVWMEKEQLYQTGLSLKRILVARESPVDAAIFQEPAYDAYAPIKVEFKTDELALQHDPASDVFTVIARHMPNDDLSNDGFLEIAFSFHRDKAKEISERCFTVVAAGRKPCPLCELPLETGASHFCVKVNGYNSSENPMGS